MSKDIPKYAWVAVYATDWTHTGYEQFDEAEAMDLSPASVRIAGHLIKDSDDFVTLASQVFHDGTYRHLVSIPTGCIKQITRLVPMKEPGEAACENLLKDMELSRTVTGWVPTDGSQLKDRFVGGME